MIFLSGMIGVGKTTYARHLVDRLASKGFYESVDDNPILEKFYANPEQYALMSQLYFLTTRFQAMEEASIHPQAVFDRSIQEDLLFADVNHSLSRLSDDEKIVYDTVAETLLNQTKHFEGPHLHVYFKASFPTILKRIALRDRSYEQDESLLEYYRALHTRYDKWMEANVEPAFLLTIDADQYDVNVRADREYVLGEIVRKVQWLGMN